jgi:hypothetical protein
MPELCWEEDYLTGSTGLSLHARKTLGGASTNDQEAAAINAVIFR